MSQKELRREMKGTDNTQRAPEGYRVCHRTNFIFRLDVLLHGSTLPSIIGRPLTRNVRY